MTAIAISALPIGMVLAQARPTLGLIDGIVTDTSLVPVAGADSSIQRTGIRVATTDNGRFRITAVPAGEYLLTIRKVGYEPVVRSIEVGTIDTLRLSITLERAQASLDTVVVRGKSQSPRMAAFDRRRELGRGQFLTQEDIAKRNVTFGTELMRTFTGVNVKMYPGAGGQMQYFAVSTRSGTTDQYRIMTRRGTQEQAMQGCPMQVYIDGVAMPTPFSLDELPSPRNIAGVELYSGPATTPVEFGGAERKCGVVAVWTRDGS